MEWGIVAQYTVKHDHFTLIKKRNRNRKLFRLSTDEAYINNNIIKSTVMLW